MRPILEKLLRRESLSREEMTATMDVIMDGQATPAQIAAFLIALRMKGETVDEVAGGVTSMRRHAVAIDAQGLDVVDTCGTGGDARHTFNISTAAALVAAGAGVPVAKHGNRAVSSACGSADVLAALGVNLDLPPAAVEACLREAGVCFLFAPALHPAMKHAGPVRRELGVRTIFNMLGPLTNPAGARRQLLGVFDPAWTELAASVLAALGSVRALVVHGSDGMDEITVTGPTRISEVRDGVVRTWNFDPADLAPRARLEDLAGGDAGGNAAIIRRVLDGEVSPRRDVVCLNAGAALVAGGRVDELADGFALAGQAIDSGAARGALDRLVAVSRGA